MKGILKIAVMLVFSTLCLLLYQCGLIEEFYGFRIKNESGHSIAHYVATTKPDGFVYPDTTLPASSRYVIFGDPRFNVFYWDIREPLADFFKKNLLVDTMSVYIFHPDTLAKYSWDEVRNDYMILRRYDLSLKNVEQHNFTVIYPPDSTMKNIKMYPPYGQ